MGSRVVSLIAPPTTNDSRWCLRNYLIRSDPAEEVNTAEHNSHLRRLLFEIEERHLSDEFEYYRLGFILGHLGKRGICISFWHWGRWGASHELFNQAWYAYGRDYANLAFLDRREPAFCEFEVPLLLREFEFFHQTVSNSKRTITNQDFVRLAVRL